MAYHYWMDNNQNEKIKLNQFAVLFLRTTRLAAGCFFFSFTNIFLLLAFWWNDIEIQRTFSRLSETGQKYVFRYCQSLTNIECFVHFRCVKCDEYETNQNGPNEEKHWLKCIQCQWFDSVSNVYYSIDSILPKGSNKKKMFAKWKKKNAKWAIIGVIIHKSMKLFQIMAYFHFHSTANISMIECLVSSCCHDPNTWFGWCQTFGTKHNVQTKIRRNFMYFKLKTNRTMKRIQLLLVRLRENWIHLKPLPIIHPSIHSFIHLIHDNSNQTGQMGLWASFKNNNNQEPGKQRTKHLPITKRIDNGEKKQPTACNYN